MSAPTEADIIEMTEDADVKMKKPHRRLFLTKWKELLAVAPQQAAAPPAAPSQAAAGGQPAAQVPAKYVAAEKQIHIYAVKGDWQLDGSIQSRIVAMVFAMASEIERDLISQRTKEALAAKKQMGMKLGRPRGTGKSKLDKHRTEIEALLANGSTQKSIAERYHTSEVNLSRWLKKRGIKR